ncbi:kelch-like protein 41b [Arctopsyche grandis]|uniref:kelch-like protein 41b n=1 Tax=Arctopsyche grandis TaxID=121162 RepID=UPI00406D910A
MSDSNVFFPSGYSNSDQGNMCLGSIYNLYRQQRFLDATFTVGDETFKVHKIVMAVNSSYFMENFNDNDTDYDFPELADFDSNALSIIIRYFYTGNIDVDSDSIANVINLAEFLKVPALVEKLTGSD